MKLSTIRNIVLSGIIGLSLVGCVTEVSTSVPVARGSKWVPGHYNRNNVWVPGHYMPRATGAVKGNAGVWVPGHYNRFGGWVPGHWR